MHHAANLGPHTVNRQVHAHLGGALARPADFVAVQIADDDIVRRHHALAYARGRRQNPFFVQTNGDVAVVGRDPAFVEHQPSDLDDVVAKLWLGFLHPTALPRS